MSQDSYLSSRPWRPRKYTSQSGSFACDDSTLVGHQVARVGSHLTSDLVPISSRLGGVSLSTQPLGSFSFTDQETEAQRGCHLPEVTQLEASSLKPRPVCFQSPRVNPTLGAPSALSPAVQRQGQELRKSRARLWWAVWNGTVGGSVT